LGYGGCIFSVVRVLASATRGAIVGASLAKKN
jgi:hypothetical protein